MKLPTTVRYSLRLLIAIKNSDGFMNLAEASRCTGVSENYLKQLASALEKHGIVKGKKGPNGGYTIANRNVSLKDLVDIFSGGIQLAPCTDENYECALFNSCPAKKMWRKLNDDVGKLFENVKLEEF